MIRIRKPAAGPVILQERGGSLTVVCCQAVENDAVPEFDRTVYGHTSVKQALVETQHGKCCYCESKVGPASYGDVEHFRPKGAVRQGDNDLELKPGYYWLAYTWSNLYLSCQRCNQSYKRTFFPLMDASRRVRSHLQATSLAQESPLLLDPAVDDPERSIGFRNEVPFAHDERGKTTIRYLGLANTQLCEDRAGTLAIMDTLLRIITITGELGKYADDAEEAMANLRRMRSDHGVYAAAIRARLRVRLGDAPFPATVQELRRRLTEHDQDGQPAAQR